MRSMPQVRASMFVALIGLWISGCQESHTLSAAGGPGMTPELPIEAPTESRDAEPVEAKPIPPIDISYELVGDAQVGRPLALRVTSRSQLALTNVSFQVYGDERVEVAQVASERNVARLPRDEAMIRTVTVTPLVDGASHVSVLVRADVNGVTQARSILIPIRVGASAARADPPEPDGNLMVDESGELIISLPAQETP